MILLSSVIRNFLITASDGKRYNTKFYNLDAESQFEEYRTIQDRLFESDFDKFTKKLLRKHQLLTTKNN